MGLYTLTAASPAAEQALLRALTFTPAAAASGTTTSLGVLVSNGTATATNDATTVAITQPNVPVVTWSLADDTGASATDRTTADDALTGTAGVGDTVTLSDGATVCNMAVASGTGAYSFTPAGLADGPYTLTATDTVAGGTGSASLAFTLDTTAPLVTDPIAMFSGSEAANSIGITGRQRQHGTATLAVGALPRNGAGDVHMLTFDGLHYAFQAISLLAT